MIENGCYTPHDDVLVITFLVANYMTKRILVDNDSSTNVLFWEAFTKMGINVNKLRPSPTQLKGLSGDTIQSAGTITLLMTVGTRTRMATTMIDFLVVKSFS